MQQASTPSLQRMQQQQLHAQGTIAHDPPNKRQKRVHQAMSVAMELDEPAMTAASTSISSDTTSSGSTDSTKSESFTEHKTNSSSDTGSSSSSTFSAAQQSYVSTSPDTHAQPTASSSSAQRPSLLLAQPDDILAEVLSWCDANTLTAVSSVHRSITHVLHSKFTCYSHITFYVAEHLPTGCTPFEMRVAGSWQQAVLVRPETLMEPFKLPLIGSNIQLCSKLAIDFPIYTDYDHPLSNEIANLTAADYAAVGQALRLLKQCGSRITSLHLRAVLNHPQKAQLIQLIAPPLHSLRCLALNCNLQASELSALYSAIPHITELHLPRVIDSDYSAILFSPWPGDPVTGLVHNMSGLLPHLSTLSVQLDSMAIWPCIADMSTLTDLECLAEIVRFDERMAFKGLSKLRFLKLDSSWHGDPSVQDDADAVSALPNVCANLPLLEKLFISGDLLEFSAGNHVQRFSPLLNLRSLHLVSAERVTDTSFQALLTAAPLLSELELSDLEQINSAAAGDAIVHIKSLERLTISRCFTDCSNHDAFELPEMRPTDQPLAKLTFFEYDGNMTPLLMSRLPRWMTNLQQLKLFIWMVYNDGEVTQHDDRNTGSGDCVLNAVAQLAALRHLEIRAYRAWYLNDSDSLNVLRSLHQLQSVCLSLEGSEQLVNDGLLQRLLPAWPLIHDLRLHDCCVTEAVLQLCQRHSPLLRHIAIDSMRPLNKRRVLAARARFLQQLPDASVVIATMDQRSRVTRPLRTYTAIKEAVNEDAASDESECSDEDIDEVYDHDEDESDDSEGPSGWISLR